MYTEILKMVLAYGAGFLTGVLLSRKRPFSLNASCLRIIIGIVITCVWMISSLAQIWKPGYITPWPIHGIMGSVAGFLFGVEGIKAALWGRKKNNE